MRTIDQQQELEFIHSEKTKISNEKSLQSELLNLAQVLISNYINAETSRTKRFYKVVYCKSKKFYLKQYASSDFIQA